MLRSVETPTGAIDGANKSYTTAYTLYQAVYITVDGVIYTGTVTYAGNVFTLADAPTASITITYYDSALSSTVSGTLLVSEIYTIWARQKQDVSDVSDDIFLDWCDWLNKFAYRHILGINSERFIEETTMNATSGQEWIYLPTDFRDIQRFGCGLYVYTDGTRNETSLTITNPNSSTAGYYIKNDRLYLRPTPVESATYMLRYAPDEPVITLATDYFISALDARYTQYIVQALNVLYNEWDENLGAEGISEARFVRLLDELSRNVSQEPTVYAMEDTSLNF